MITIRSSEPADYEFIANLLTIARPELPVTPDMLRYRDSVRPPHCVHRVWIAQEAGVQVGMAQITQYADLYDAHALWVSIIVHPDHRTRGIGTALAETLHSIVEQMALVQRLQTTIREDRIPGLHFAQKLGFAARSRRFDSVLDISTFDFDANPARAHLPEHGIEIMSMTELLRDPDRDRKFYDLYWLLDSDVPIDEPITRLSFEDFRAQVIDNPSFLHDGTFVAVNAAHEYIGTVALFSDGGDSVDVDLTGTRADYRGRGIATMLKIYGIHWAQRQQFRYMTVTNDEYNAGMLHINARLGFVRQPALITLQKIIARP